MTPEQDNANEIQNPKVQLKMSMSELNGQLFKLEDESIEVLKGVAELFENGRFYREKEVNQILKEVYDDYIALRRFLVEYGLLDRKSDGSQYWRKVD